MARVRIRRQLVALVLVSTTLGLVPMLPTLADQQQVDGDLLTAGVQNDVTRSAAPGSLVLVTARLQVRHESNVHVAAGSTVSFVRDTAATNLPSGAVVSGGSVQIPANWGPGGAASASSVSLIAFQAPTAPGTYDYEVGWVPSPAAPGITKKQVLKIRLRVTGPQPPADTVPPVLDLPTGLQVEATGVHSPVDFKVAATDAVDGTVPVACTPAPGAAFIVGATTVTCHADDAAGNRAQGSFTVTVVDTTAPVVSPAAGVTASATSPSGALVTFTPPAANDLVDGGLATTCSPVPGATFPIGESTVTCTATDAAGNAASTTFVVTVTGDELPTVAGPDTVTVEATSASGATVDLPVTGADHTGATLPVSCVPASGSAFTLGTTTVTCTATDGSGRTNQRVVAVVVIDGAPVLHPLEDVVVEATGPAGSSATFTATADDAVDGTLPATCSPASGSTFPLGDTVVTCTAVDHLGHADQATFVVTVRDTTAPTLSLPEGIAGVEATGAGGAGVNFTTTAIDAVDGTVDVTCSSAPGSTLPIGTTTVNCTAADASGNVTWGTFEVEVVDTTAPELTVPAELVVEAEGPGGAVADFTASATDAVSGALAVSCDADSGAPFALGTTTVTCTATDDNGNVTTRTFTIEVRDTTAPAFGTVGDVTFEAAGAGGTTVDYQPPTATDAVDGTVDVTCDPPAGAALPTGPTAVTCSATDAAGNVASASFTVVVSDTTGPNLALPLDQAVEATGPGGASVTVDVSAVDAVDGGVQVACDPPTSSAFPLGTTLITCTATDAAGNTTTGSFTVTVADTTAPTLTVPSDLTVEADLPGGAHLAYTPTAVDAVDATVQVDCNVAPGSFVALGATVVTCTAVDATGNEATASFTVTVADTTSPTLSLPANRTVEAAGPGGTTVAFVASATDAASDAVVVTCEPASGTTFEIGTTTVTCSAVDDAGNTRTGSFTVTVADATAPALQLPGDVTVEAQAAAGTPVDFLTSAVDEVDGAVEVTCSEPPGATFAVGTTVVTCSASDGAGNTATGSFTVAVVDTTAPALTLPSSVAIGPVGADGAAVTYDDAIAVDAVGGPLPATCSPPSGTQLALGQHVVTCTATDAAGNTTAGSFTVTVADQDAPVLILPTGVHETATGTGTPVTFEASAFDDVDGTLAATCQPPSGASFPMGTTTVTCTATDAAGNVATDAFDVVVEDVDAPELTLPGAILREADVAGGGVVTYVASASDAVDGAVGVTCSQASGATFALGTTTVTCTATDSSGNASSGTFDVQVIDTTPPALTLPTGVAAAAPSPDGAVVTFGATAVDIVAGSRPVTCTPASGATFPVGTTSVTCTANDGHGNTADGTFAVVVSPSAITRVEFVLNGNGFASNVWINTSASPIHSYNPYCSQGNCVYNASGTSGPMSYTFTLAEPARLTVYGASTTDTASRSYRVDGGPTVAFSDHGFGSIFGRVPFFTTPLLRTGQHTLVINAGATDYPLHLDYVDIAPDPVAAQVEPPALTVPADILLRTPALAGTNATFTTTAFDIYGVSLPVTCTPASGSLFPGGATTVTCSATDARGHTTTKAFTVTVIVETTRVEFITNGSGFSSAAWINTSTSPIHTYNSRCTGGNCVYNTSSATAAMSYSFTLTQPARVTVYGAPGNPAASRSWTIDSNAPVSFVDAGGVSGVPYFTTPMLSVGAHTLRTYYGTDNTIALYLDYLDIVTNDTDARVTPPLLTVPADMVIRTPSATGTSVTYATSAKDIYGVTLTPSCAPASGATFGGGTTTVTCSATDARANTTTKTFKVRIIPATTRVEIVAGNGGGWSSAAWISTLNSPIHTYNSRCTTGCVYNTSSATNGLGYTFTLTAPARVTMYGAAGSPMAYRQWRVDSQPLVTFIDGGPVRDSPFYTTGLLQPGTHTLRTYFGTDNTIALYLDYLDIVSE